MWSEKYKTAKFYWGFKPTPEIIKLAKHIPKGKVLDIGAGEGRNSIYLAQNGFGVEAIDKIKQGLKKCRNFAKEHNLPIKTKMIDIRNFKFERNRYSGIICVATIDFLKLSEIANILEKIRLALTQDGIFYFTAFSTKDPAYRKCKKGLEMVGKNTFFLPRFNTFRHFFEKNELLKLLSEFKVIELKEERIKDNHEKIHFHNIFKVLAKIEHEVVKCHCKVKKGRRC